MLGLPTRSSESDGLSRLTLQYSFLSIIVSSILGPGSVSKETLHMLTPAGTVLKKNMQKKTVSKLDKWMADRNLD